MEESTLYTAGGERLEDFPMGKGLQSFYQSAPPMFYCPSRRGARAYPFKQSGNGHWSLSVAQGVLLLPVRHRSAVSKRSLLWTELPKFFEFFRQANMQWAFPTQSVEKRFGLRQRAASGFFSSKETPPCIHHVPFVQYAPSYQAVKVL
jgi:hypothetical protein